VQTPGANSYYDWVNGAYFGYASTTANSLWYNSQYKQWDWNASQSGENLQFRSQTQGAIEAGLAFDSGNIWTLGTFYGNGGGLTNYSTTNLVGIIQTNQINMSQIPTGGSSTPNAATTNNPNTFTASTNSFAGTLGVSNLTGSGSITGFTNLYSLATTPWTNIAPYATLVVVTNASGTNIYLTTATGSGGITYAFASTNIYVASSGATYGSVPSENPATTGPQQLQQSPISFGGAGGTTNAGNMTVQGNINATGTYSGNGSALTNFWYPTNFSIPIVPTGKSGIWVSNGWLYYLTAQHPNGVLISAP
jgi:hypothetical protein